MTAAGQAAGEEAEDDGPQHDDGGERELETCLQRGQSGEDSRESG